MHVHFVGISKIKGSLIMDLQWISGGYHLRYGHKVDGMTNMFIIKMSLTSQYRKTINIHVLMNFVK